MKKGLPIKLSIKKGLMTILLIAVFFGKVNAAYFWQVQSIISFTGSATYSQFAPANPLVLSLQQCAGGISLPHNSTVYNQTLYMNTLNSTVGGTVVSSNVIGTPFIFAPSYSYTPSTSTVGTLYYYYMLTSPSMTTCGFTGTLTSQIATVTVAAPGAAINFDGIDDYSNTGNGITNALNGSTKVTVEAWVKPSSLSGLGCIVGNYSTPNAGNLQILLRRSGNSFYEFWVGNAGIWNNVNSIATPTAGIWQHVAGVWDGTVARIFVNGVLSGTVSTTIPSLSNLANNVWIGANNIAENFAGDIDEVRIWNRALCQGEIQNNRNCEIPTSASGLIANYHFNQGVASGANPTETTSIDASGNSYTGTLTNMALNGATSNWIAPGGVTSGSSCGAFVPPTISVNSGAICSGNSFTMIPSGASTYTYSSGSAIVSPTANASYSVTGTNSLGCVASNTAVSNVTVNANPTITVNSGSICSGNSFTMTPGGASTYTFSSGSAIVSPTATSAYTVAGTNSVGCISNAVANVTVNICAAAEALNFDGGNDYVNAGNGITTSINGSTKLTVEAWVKPASLSGLGCIVGNYNTTTSGNLQLLLRRSGNSFYEFWVGNAGIWNNVNSIATPTAGVWQHVAGVWDGTVARIFVNGVLSGTVSTTIPSLSNLANNVWIGANNIAENFSGDIDEVRIWNKALCQGEIVNNMNGEIPTTASGLVANYHFNQGLAAQPNPTVTSLIDASGNSYTGTLTNFALTGSTSNWIAPGAVTGSVTSFVSPTVAITGTNSVCTGNSVTLTANGNVTSYSWVSGPSTASNVVTPTVTTTYTVSGMNMGCLSNIAVHTVTVNNLPTVSVTSGSICTGSSFTMVPSGASTYTYSSGSAVVSPTANSSYTVIGTDANGCNGNAVSNVTVNICSSAQAFNFDGIDDYVDAGNSVTSTLNGSTKVTVEAWVKPSSLSGLGCIVGNYSTPNAGNLQILLRRSGNSFYEFWVGNAGIWNNVNSIATPTAGIWQHVAGVWDGTVARIFVNGVLSGTVSTTIPSLSNLANNVWIGANNIAENFAGDIDEVRIWNRDLCQGEVVNYMNGEIATNSTGLIANYHFNQGLAAQPNPTVTTLIDATSNAYTGTLTNVALTGATSNWVSPGAVSGSASPFVSPTVAITGSGAVCSGNSTTLTANGTVTSFNWVSGPTTSVNVVTPTVTTSYSVSGMNMGCPSNVAVQTVTLNNLPTVSASTSSSIICTLPTQQTANLTATGANTYTWSTSASGSTIAVSPSVTTTYTVTGTDANGCENTAVITQSVSTCAGITEYISGLGVSVYPNPNIGIFNVYIQNVDINTTISVINVIGQTVLKKEVVNEKTLVNLQEFENGIYFINVSNNNSKQIIKIVKQ